MLRVIAITETWAIPSTPDGFYKLLGYNILRADRCDRRRGGVMIYIQETITISEIQLLDEIPEFEFCVARFILTSMSV